MQLFLRIDVAYIVPVEGPAKQQQLSDSGKKIIEHFFYILPRMPKHWWMEMGRDNVQSFRLNMNMMVVDDRLVR